MEFCDYVLISTFVSVQSLLRSNLTTRWQCSCVNASLRKLHCGALESNAAVQCSAKWLRCSASEMQMSNATHNVLLQKGFDK